MDIFGQALLDFQNGIVDRSITIKRDDGHKDEHSPALYFDELPQNHEVAVLDGAKGPVLDVGCGAGRHLLRFQKMGIPATGIDVSKAAVETCRLRGCKDARLFDIMSKEALSIDQPFQTALLFGNNVGIAGTIEGAEKLFRRLRSLVAPGGRLLLSSIDVAQTDRPEHLEYHQKNIANGRPKGEIKMQFSYQGQHGDWVDWYHPSPEEVDLLAKTSGWTVEQHVKLPNGQFASELHRIDAL